MTKLEQEMMDVISDYGFPEANAKAAAEVAKKYIKNALIDGFQFCRYSSRSQLTLFEQEAWLKKNGIIE